MYVRTDICIFGALCSVPFDLICNMTTFRKKNGLTFYPYPGVEGVSVGKIFATMLLFCSANRYHLCNFGRG